MYVLLNSFFHIYWSDTLYFKLIIFSEGTKSATHKISTQRPTRKPFNDIPRLRAIVGSSWVIFNHLILQAEYLKSFLKAQLMQILMSRHSP
jgi:hypothetical protein